MAGNASDVIATEEQVTTARLAILSQLGASGIAKNHDCLNDVNIRDSDARHETFLMIVNNGSMIANILYRFELLNGTKSKFALINADLVFSGFLRNERGDLFIKNAKLSQIAEYIK